MTRAYIGKVKLHCAIGCWRSTDAPVWAASLAAADFWVRHKACAYCGEALAVSDPIAEEALAQWRARQDADRNSVESIQAGE